MFESFRDQDLKDTGSCGRAWSRCPCCLEQGGTTRESLIEGAKQKHTQREGLYDLRIRCRGGGHIVTGSELLATSQLTIHPLPPKVGKFKWNYIFSGGKFPISTIFCNSLSVPNVSQTCKLVNNTLIGPEGPYKLIAKN